MPKRKRSTNEEENADDENYLGPFSAELILIIAHYIPCDSALALAISSKTLANLLFREPKLWEYYVHNEFELSPERKKLLLNDTNGSYKRVSARLCKAQRSLTSPDAQVVPRISKTGVEWAEMHYPRGTILGALRFGFRQAGHMPRMAVEAWDYVTNKKIHEWNITARLDNGGFWYDHSIPPLVSNNRFVGLHVFATGEEDEDNPYFWLFDGETGASAAVIEKSSTVQRMYLRGSRAWSLLDDGADYIPPWASPLDLGFKYVIVAFDCLTGAKVFELKLNEQIFFDPSTSVDDTHLLYNTHDTAVLVDLQTSQEFARFSLTGGVPLTPEAPNRFGHPSRVKSHSMLSSECAVVYNKHCAYIWDRKNGYDGALPFILLLQNKIHMTHFHEHADLIWIKGHTLVIATPQLRIYKNILQVHQTTKNTNQTTHDSSTGFEVVTCEADPIVTTKKVALYMDQHTIIVTNGVNAVVWNAETGKKVRTLELRPPITHAMYEMDHSAYAFVDGPYLVGYSLWLNLWDFSGASRELRRATRMTPTG